MEVSIIIPCFNSGEFIGEAIQSIISSKFTQYEILVVDDGSTDSKTLFVLEDLQKKNFTVIRQENKGPAAARNAGVRASKYEVLLFLDSDNRIKEDYLYLANSLFENDSQIGVVYARPSFFGDLNSSKRFSTRNFNFEQLLVGNYIDICAFIRKSVWSEIGGFDESRVLISYEDWDFWLRIAQTNWKFYFIDKELYDYRLRDNSLIHSINQEREKELMSYIYHKHHIIFHKKYKYYFRMFSQFDKKPLLFTLKYLFKKYLYREKYH